MVRISRCRLTSLPSWHASPPQIGDCYHMMRIDTTMPIHLFTKTALSLHRSYTQTQSDLRGSPQRDCHDHFASGCVVFFCVISSFSLVRSPEPCSILLTTRAFCQPRSHFPGLWPRWMSQCPFRFPKPDESMPVTALSTKLRAP
jgi:hypothetical protein